jgi:hypothetical protein
MSDKISQHLAVATLNTFGDVRGEAVDLCVRFMRGIYSHL